MDENLLTPLNTSKSEMSRALAPLMTVREVAAFLNVQPSTVYRLADRHLLPTLRMGATGRMLRFKREDILNWLQQKCSL